MLRTRASLLALCLTLLSAAAALPAPAGAQLLLPAEPGVRFGDPLSIRAHEVDVIVDSQVARVTVGQVFESHRDTTLSGTYVFALPETAAVSSFATWVAGRRVDSRVEEKAQAEATYQRAARQGAAPALLENLQPGVFRTRVEGIPASGTKRTELTYSQILPYEGGEVVLKLPLQVPGVTPVRVRHFRARIKLADRTKKIVRVWSDGTPVATNRIDERTVEAIFAQDDFIPDQDIVLHYSVESDELGFTFLTHREKGDDGYFLLSIAPQELTTDADIVKKDVLFVFDTSGSMAGSKIEQARRALARCIELLQPEDRFSVLAFSDSTNPWNKDVVPATLAHRADARHFAARLSSGGGTAIDASLKKALRMLPPNGRPRVIVFFTDGQPSTGETHPDRILANIQAANTDGTRIFTFGVTGGVNTRLLDELARQNRGESAYVTAGRSIDEVVAGFYSSISRPVLSDIDFDYDPVTVAMQYPAVMPDIYKGQQLLIAGRYRGAGEGKVVLEGSLNGEARRFEIPVTFPEEHPGDAFVARQWAQRRVDHLLAEIQAHGQTPEMRDEVVRLGRSYHLVTPYTSMVAAPQVALASLSPARIKPGDPEVLVPAAADARAVLVYLPFGEVRRAVYDARRELWVARFLVPPDVVDGVYPVTALVLPRVGPARRHELSYTVDTRAPVLAVDPIDPTEAGGLFELRVRPRTSLLSLVDALADSGLEDAVEIAKTFADVKYVSAFLWDGREVELGLTPGESGWSATIETPSDLPAGEHALRIVAVDWAGNLRTTHATLTVTSSELALR
ncbi:MAG: VIT domain-containing protein [Deltaproteobacteria bacterium]|nr:VIT domain-containing protein [Deltaproteobacteria bacterium]